MEKHTAQHPEKLHDPYLGPVWMNVGCDWCGAKGRYDLKGVAQKHADKHNRRKA